MVVVFIVLAIMVDFILMIFYPLGVGCLIRLLLIEFSWGYFKLGFIVDLYSLRFSLVVLLVSVVVIVFMAYYIGGCGSINYLVGIVVLFILGMLILVFSGRFVVSYIG